MDFIPIQFYNKFYYYIILIFVFAIYFNSLNSKIESNTNIKTISLIGLFLLIFVFFYMALRPISIEFGDMWTYSKHFEQLQNGEPANFEKDPLFEYMMLIFSKFSTSKFFFFFCSVLYVIPIYFVTKKLFLNYWAYAFLIITSSISFWAYGTNGIRNGLATSIFLLAICQKNNFLKLVIFLIAFLFHKSLILPILAYFISLFYKNSKTYFYFWIFAIPFSFLIGSTLESFFLRLGFGGSDSLTSYLGEFDQESEGEIIKIGFRWDFIIYSATAVYSAWYFIFKKKYNDAFYNQLVNIYLICNTLWILIIRANYSNRFAYLSWFMLGLITIYPMLKLKFFNNQHVVIGRIILAFFALTFLLNVLLLVKS